jgi:16S rRNA (guanine1207-N2)-methyltransferase
MSEDYRQIISFQAALRGEPLTVLAKPGLPGGPQVEPAAALCARLIAPAPDERALLLGCGHGALGVALARLLPAGRLTLHDPSLIALRMAARTLEANGVAGLVDGRISRLPDEAGAYDRVVILVPQSRALARRWLVEAHGLLRPGGTLTVAGANALGVQSIVADAAALFGAAAVLGYGGGARVAEALRRPAPPAPPPWAGEPGIAPGTWAIVVADLPGGAVELASLPGVFSADRLDVGTAFLLQHLDLRPGLRVLDAGCGYGPIGVAAARRGAVWTTMLDVNMLAVAAAAENLRRLNLAAAAEALPSDGLEAAAGPYDLVVSNPPFHAGREVDTAMTTAFIAEARALLAPGGRLALVANRFLPYERHLAPHFAHVETTAAGKSYKLLVAAASR